MAREEENDPALWLLALGNTCEKLACAVKDDSGLEGEELTNLVSRAHDTVNAVAMHIDKEKGKL